MEHEGWGSLSGVAGAAVVLEQQQCPWSILVILVIFGTIRMVAGANPETAILLDTCNFSQFFGTFYVYVLNG